MCAHAELKSIAGRLFAQDAIERHPLFVRLEAGQIPEARVRAIALQIHHVVAHFPRFLAALLANIPDYRTRMPLVENLFEEHGRMSPQAVHVETHARFLGALGIGAADIAASRPGIAVLVYNRAVTDLCLHHPFPEAPSEERLPHPDF